MANTITLQEAEGQARDADRMLRQAKKDGDLDEALKNAVRRARYVFRYMRENGLAKADAEKVLENAPRWVPSA